MTPGLLWSKLRRSSLAGNVLALYSLQTLNYAINLFTVPYLARVLGPAGLGVLAVAQALANYVAIVVGFGFDLSATRAVAQAKQRETDLGELYTSVLATQLLLGAAAAVLALAARGAVTTLASDSRLYWAAIFNGILIALNPVWYFQGRERMRTLVLLDTAGKVFILYTIFRLIASPADSWRLLFTQAAVLLATTVMVSAVVRREVTLRGPTRRSLANVCRMSWKLFVYKCSTVFSSAGNAFVLSFFATSSSVVGYYAGAERINRAWLLCIFPLNQALFPYLNRMAGQGTAESTRNAKRVMLFMAVGGLAIGILAFFTAPVAVALLLGPQFTTSAQLLGVMSVLPMLAALNFLLGMQCMLPAGMDREFNTVTVLSGIVNLSLAVVLAPRYQHWGMAYASITAESLALCLFYISLRRAGLDPLKGIIHRSQIEPADRLPAPTYASAEPCPQVEL
jgi:polysaccharide transporter, PST family